MSVDAREFVVDWIHRCAASLDESVTMLTELDALRGDADHGVNMQKGFAAADDAVQKGASVDAGAVLIEASTAIRRTIGGTSGPLWSIALRRMGKALGPSGELTPAALGTALTAAVQGVSELGGACLGEGTMLDALAPAANALVEAADEPLEHALALATEAAESGAQGTSERIATKGRAAYLGERALGSPDPGAVSAAIVVRAFSP